MCVRYIGRILPAFEDPSLLATQPTRPINYFSAIANTINWARQHWLGGVAHFKIEFSIRTPIWYWRTKYLLQALLDIGEVYFCNGYVQYLLILYLNINNAFWKKAILKFVCFKEFYFTLECGFCKREGQTHGWTCDNEKI